MALNKYQFNKKKRLTTISGCIRLLMVLSLSFCMLSTVCVFANTVETLEQGFENPGENSRPWVYWLWINGNVTKEGITADLESFKRIGIGGVLWMEVSGPWWAPDGQVEPLSPKWHDAFGWAISECQRLGLTFDVTLDFGYGSGGPHITPELSMQKLFWSEQEVQGGQTLELKLKKPHVEKKISAWLRPGVKMNPKVVQAIEQTDSYRDVAVLAIALPRSQAARDYRIPAMPFRSGLSNRGQLKEIVPPPGAITVQNQVLDLTALMGSDGNLKWKAPGGKWLVIRYGHASNYKMTRPCPALAVGLECDRLSQSGIDAHFDGFLKKIIEDAGSAKGGTLAYAHIDSWEAGAQNWTASFPEEFEKRRGYDLRPWLVVLTGRVVGSADLSERFLWDVRLTASEMIQENYALRFRELLSRHGMKLSIEAYGDLSIDNLSYAGISDMPISEFWASGEGQFPISAGRAQVLLELSSKAMASAAHTYGKSIIGAEAFTADRGWRDHPFLLKSMGDKMFCYGVNRMIFHLAVHQPYDNMIPGMTHRRWGQHIQRHNTWFEYSGPWMDYLSRCQYLLQEGTFVADVCYWFGEGSPLNATDMGLNIPDGYDYDLCSSELVLQMKVNKGRIILPSGMSYRYLLLPDTDRMTLPLARKIKELVDAGATVIAQKRLTGSPSLTDYQEHDSEIKKIATQLWDSNRLIFGENLEEVFAQDKLNADFEGQGLRYIHRSFGDADIYFVSNPENRQRQIACTFRVSQKLPQLWNPSWIWCVHLLPPRAAIARSAESYTYKGQKLPQQL